MNRRKDDFEDDGRSIADMSGVSGPSLFLPRRSREKREDPAVPAQSDRPWEKSGMSREDRRHYIWGALSAALLIALAFIVGLGLVIALICILFT